MVDVFYEGSRYRFFKNENEKYWTGVSGGGGLFPGINCVAPRCIWPRLQSVAVERGISVETFRINKPEERERVARVSKKKSKKPSISIF